MRALLLALVLGNLLTPWRDDEPSPWAQRNDRRRERIRRWIRRLLRRKMEIIHELRVLNERISELDQEIERRERDHQRA